MLYSYEHGILKARLEFPVTLGTIGKPVNETDYSKDKNIIRTEEISILEKSLNIKKENVFMLNQVHGDSIIALTGHMPDNSAFPDADGMITDINGLCLVLRTADCVPVFVFDVENKVLGAVHSGWRGCSLNISGKLIRKMKAAFNSKEKDLHVFILPSIGPESYSVNMDVGSLFKNDIIKKEKVIYLDLWRNINSSMIEEGIPEVNIHQSAICTYLNNAHYFSHRRGDSGRNLNFCFIQKGFHVQE